MSNSYPQYPVQPGAPDQSSATAAATGPRPRAVSAAITITWLKVLLAVVGIVVSLVLLDEIIDQQVAALDMGGDASVDAAAQGARIGAWIGIGLQAVITVGLYSLLAIFLGRRANWARITLTVLVGLGTLLGLAGLVGIATGAQPLLLTLLSLVGLVLNAALLVLLWLPVSNAWFSPPRAPVA